MNPDTGDIRRFENMEEASKDGYTIPIPEELVEELRAMEPEERKKKVADMLANGELPTLEEMASRLTDEQLEDMARATAHTKDAIAELQERTLHKGRTPQSTVQLLATMSSLSAVGRRTPAGNPEKLIGRRGHGHTHFDSPPYQSPHKGSKKSTPATRAKRRKNKAQRAARKKNR